MNNKSYSNQAGFTLVELLTVIAIIGMMASIVTTSLGATRKKARDIRRIADMKQLSTAIDLFIDDNGHAPYLEEYDCSAFSPSGKCSSVSEVDGGIWEGLGKDLQPYLNKMPRDPCGISCYDQNNDKFFAYVYISPYYLSLWCESTGCGLGEDQLNLQYGIFAENMEVDSDLLNITYKNIPTFGIIGHQFGSSF